MNSFKKIIENEDWVKYSNCEDGYINVSDEKMMNGFLCDFKNKCDPNFINYFKYVEKNVQDEFQIFDYSQSHYHDLERLLLQGKATLQPELIKKSFKYLNALQEIEKLKIETFTRYFVENFEKLKNDKNKELSKGTSADSNDELPETFWEWENKTEKIKLGFFANNLAQNTFRTVSTKFNFIPIFVREFHKNFVVNNSVVRFLWYNYDIREYLWGDQIKETYTPYMSISGTYFIEEIKYPLKSLEKGDWIIRDMIGEEYKHGEGQDGSFTKNVKMRYKVILPEKIYLKDIKEVSVGLYNQETRKWQLDAQEVVFRDEEHEKKNKEKYTIKVVEFTCSELGIFSVLLERKINFPYKSWNLRCIKNPENNQLLAILNLETPRTKFVFELGIDDPDLNFESNVKHDPVKAYVKLIDNEEEEFNHIADKKLTFDEMILAMKECGILLAPWKEDIEASGIKEKNQETIDRAVDDIVMACRYYSIKSHELNKLINQDLIAVKAKPNPEFDKYFFDDEEKDWTDFCWYPNKASIGRFEIKTEGEESTIEFVSSIETTRPHLHLVIKDTQPEEVYEQISEDETSSAFLVNIRNMVRVLSLVNIP